MKNKSKITPALKHGLWNLLCWISVLNNPKVRLEGVQCSSYSKELILINDANGFMYNFEIDDLKSIKYLNTVLCLWANQGIEATKDCNGISIFDEDKKLIGE